MNIKSWLRKRKKYRLGIVLSGGGARGFAHLGILKALKEKGIEPDIISGTSAGAIVGAFICAGMTPDESFEIIKSYRFFDLATIRFPRSGLFSLDSIKRSIKKEIQYTKIEELPKPLIITATNMLDGKVKYFSEGPLAACVQASASIPVLFSPVMIKGKLYSDGGVLDNLPIKPLRELCDKIIVINISPLRPIDEMKNLVQVATRMLQLGVNAGEERKKRLADLYLEPSAIDTYDILDTKHSQEIFDLGYHYIKDRDITL